MHHSSIAFILISYLLLFHLDFKAQDVKPYFTSVDSGIKTTVVKVKKSYRSTNENYITFIDSSNNKIRLNASEVKDFYDGENKYLLFTDNEGNKKLLSYKAYGDLTFAESFNKSGNLKFYLIKDSIALNMDQKKYTLNKYLRQYLQEDKPFFDSYKRIRYDYKSIGNFTSAYNVYKNPQKYSPASYRSKHFYNFYVSVGSLIGNIEFESFDLLFKQKYAYSLGTDLQLNFHRTISLYGSLFYENAAFTRDSKLNHSTLTWHSVNFDFFPALTLFQMGDITVRLGPGLGVKGILSGKTDQFFNIYGEWDNSTFNNIRFVSSVNLLVSLNDRLAVETSYRNYSILIYQYLRTGYSSAGAIASCNHFSLSLHYSLFKRYTETL